MSCAISLVSFMVRVQLFQFAFAAFDPRCKTSVRRHLDTTSATDVSVLRIRDCQPLSEKHAFAVAPDRPAHANEPGRSGNRGDDPCVRCVSLLLALADTFLTYRLFVA